MIPVFTDNEISTIRELLIEQYQKDIEIHLADSEILLNGEENAPTVCPAVFWHASETNFVVIKTAERSFRTRFFYTPHDQFGTDTDEYRELEQCVTAVLQSQSEHRRQQQNH